MKPVTRCRECSHAALYDGCTFGSVGTPRTATVSYAEGATIDGAAAVGSGW